MPHRRRMLRRAGRRRGGGSGRHPAGLRVGVGQSRRRRVPDLTPAASAATAAPAQTPPPVPVACLPPCARLPPGIAPAPRGRHPDRRPAGHPQPERSAGDLRARARSRRDPAGERERPERRPGTHPDRRHPGAPGRAAAGRDRRGGRPRHLVLLRARLASRRARASSPLGPAALQQRAKLLGQQLRALGVTVDFAPDLDVTAGP